MTAALIIAAGKTDRKDRFSPEKQIGRLSAIERIVLILKQAGIRRIVVVGDEKGLPQKLVPSMDLIFLTVPVHAEMLDSIKQGLLYLQDKCSETLVVHADVPMFSSQTIQMLLDKDKDADVCVPSYRGQCGHPVLLRSSCFEEIISYHGGSGLKGAIEASGIVKQVIDTDDAGILSGSQLGTPQTPFLSDYDVRKMKAAFRIKISKEKGFYGPGVHQLLRLTEEFGSLSNACQHMGMSYTKGRRMIATMEEQLGTPVLETGQGGKTGGYSRLTPAAKKVMDSYAAFQEEAETVLQEMFRKHFSEIDESAE